MYLTLFSFSFDSSITSHILHSHYAHIYATTCNSFQVISSMLAIVRYICRDEIGANQKCSETCFLVDEHDDDDDKIDSCD